MPKRFINKEEENRYYYLHYKMRNKKPKLDTCEDCGNKFKKLDLANISGEYKEDINDYKWLCKKCHNISHDCGRFLIKSAIEKGFSIWSDEEIECFKYIYPILDNKDISRLLGRTKSAIHNMAIKLKLKKVNIKKPCPICKKQTNYFKSLCDKCSRSKRYYHDKLLPKLEIYSYPSRGCVAQ